MKLHYVNDKEVIAECNKRGIKQVNSVFRWLKRNPDKTIDDFITYRKSKPNSKNYKTCKDNNLSYNSVRKWIERKEGRTAEAYINRPPFLTQNI